MKYRKDKALTTTFGISLASRQRVRRIYDNYNITYLRRIPAAHMVMWVMSDRGVPVRIVNV